MAAADGNESPGQTADGENAAECRLHDLQQANNLDNLSRNLVQTTQAVRFSADIELQNSVVDDSIDANDLDEKNENFELTN